ncbi:MAG: OmpA family protein [Candidatus Hydrogenedentes bacterium]|nr:OmpA family protein [Candidatus Hydrogenedentota bacterium]
MRIYTGILALATSVALTASVLGCATAGEHRTATGAVTGAAIGGGAGALIDKDNPFRGALIGAAAGTLVGGGIGHMLQRQKQAFERIEELEVQPQTVVIQQPAPPVEAGQPAPPPQQEEHQALMVRVPSEILFEQDSSAISPHGQAKLQEVAQVLTEFPDSDVYVRGFTSSEGALDYNQKLSQQRAEAVRSTLVNYGISPVRLFAIGMGPADPIASNDTESGRAMNRRVELNIVPRGEVQ